MFKMSEAAIEASNTVGALTWVTAILAAVAFIILLGIDSRVNKISDVAVKARSRSVIAYAFIGILFITPFMWLFDIGYWTS